MPLAEEHLEQARRNLAHATYLLADHADDPTCVQWAVTAAFYCAVHCVQAFLLRHGRDPRTHVEREYELADPALGVPEEVRRAYRSLKHRSESARYRLGTFDPTFVQRSLIDGYLTTVTEFVSL